MSDDLVSMVAQYRAGLEAEIALLRQLETLSMRQHDASLSGALDSLAQLHDARDRVMATLVTVEHEMKPLRQTLLERRDVLDGRPDFEEVVTFHREAAELVTTIVTSDREALEALKEAEHARRAAAKAVDRGESTLAAYRRVIAPALASATLLNRKG